MREIRALATGRVIFVSLFKSSRSLGNMLTLCASLRSLPLFTYKTYITLAIFLTQNLRYSYTFIQASQFSQPKSTSKRNTLSFLYLPTQGSTPFSQNPTMGCSSSKPIPKPASNSSTAKPPTPSPTPIRPEGKTQPGNLAPRNTPTPPFITAPSTPVPMKGPLASKYGYYDTGFTWISTRDKMME